MKLILLTIILFSLLATPSASVAQTQKNKITAGYYLALGRGPTDAELKYWISQPEKSVSDYVNMNQTWLRGQNGEATQVIQRAYMDVMGRQPTSDEINYWIGSKPTYADLFSKNVTWLNGNSSGKQDEIKMSYRAVFGRDPQPGELTYWQSQATVPYSKLVAVHQTWKNANSSSSGICTGNSITCGTSLGPINTAGVFTNMATQFANVTGAATVMDKCGLKLVAQGGGNLINPGGVGNLIASGGGNITVSNLIAAGGGN